MDRSRIDERLVYCLRAVPQDTGDGRREALSDTDWDAVFETSRRQGLAPLLYHRLRTTHADVPIPASVMESLRQAYLGNGARNMGLYQKLGRVLGLLRRDNIPVIVLKGAHLAELVYGNSALRSMSDVDLLVHKGDLLRIEAVLLGLGYTPLDYNRTIGKDNKHFGYVLAGRAMCLEVHWTLLASMYSFDVDMRGQWERSRRAFIAGSEAAVLCPEDLFLHLCLHAGESGFRLGLRHLCDVGRVLQHYDGDIDWGFVQCRVHQSGIGKCVYLTLRLAEELLGQAVPDTVMAALRRPDCDERVVALAREQVLSPPRMATGPVLSSPDVARLWGSPRLLDKAAAVFGILGKLFPPRDVMAREYPAPPGSLRIYLYYASHCRRLLRRYNRDVWQLLSGDAEMRALATRENDSARFTQWLMSP